MGKIFGRKKNVEEQQQTAVVVPEIQEDVPEIELAEQPVNPLAIQNIQQEVQQQQPMYQQPIQQAQPQQVQQSIQQAQQPIQQAQQPPQAYAYIKQAQVSEPGVFHYVIEANYPLAIGMCQIVQ